LSRWLAPQTNIAALLHDHLGEVASAIGRLIFVGGRLVEPDPPEPAEFNVGHDPEAAALVHDSGLAITMYELDVFNQVLLTSAQADVALLCTDRGGKDQGQMIQMVWVETALRGRHAQVVGTACDQCWCSA
jgi:pyrimidine-specific ribonucleoside hydrolase